MIRLGHLADTHLGHRQYGLNQREDDMVSTARATLDDLVDHDVDAVLLPGDLFHSRDLRPKVLADAERALGKVPDEVPVLVSCGNHDENLTQRHVTWLNYLHRRGKIIHLEAGLHADAEEARLAPHDPDEPNDSAGFYDISVDGTDTPVRVFGLQWRGARTDTALERVARGIRAANEEHGRPAYTVLMAHFGIEDEVPDLGATITHAELEPVREVVDYLALGHIHKQYEATGWIYNPGSPEAHSVEEGQDGWAHGYFTAKLTHLDDSANSDGPGELVHEATHHPSKRRPYYRLEFDVTPHDSRSELKAAFREAVEDEREALEEYCSGAKFLVGGDRRQPILDVRIRGTLQFDRADLRTDELADWTADTCDALHVQVNASVRTADIQQLIDELDGDSVFVDGRLNTDALERRVFETIATESEYGEHADEVADILEQSHRMAQDGEAVADIVSVVSERRRELFPGMTADVDVGVPEDPLADVEEELGAGEHASATQSADGGEAE